MSTLFDPLVSPPPAELPLRNAPLVRVIGQLRFPMIVSIEQPEFIAPFQEALRERYPVLRQDRVEGFLLTPTGPTQVPAHTVWRFGDVDGMWRVSLASGFLALETQRYESRKDFSDRLREIALALEKHIGPKLIDRLGIRYIDRIEGKSIEDLHSLLRPEVRGIAGTPAALHASHSLTETLYSVQNAGVLARWGYLPPGATVDPAAMEPSNEASWVLDLDMFTTTPKAFTVDNVVEQAKQFAERIYTIFRWAVTDDFLRRYGADI